ALLAELHALRADGTLGIELGLRLLVAHELACADEPDAARLADQRMARERRETALELRPDLAHVVVELALLVDLQRSQRDRRAHRVPRVREAVAEEPSLPARRNHRLVEELGHDHRADR